MRSPIWAFPSGSGYPLYLFCLHRAKKDAAAIPNAGFKIALRSNYKPLDQIIIPFQSKRIPLESLGLRDLLSIGTN